VEEVIFVVAVVITICAISIINVNVILNVIADKNIVVVVVAIADF
jgi:hypothetical protein